jgi:protein-disulfide isomerase
VSSRRAVLIAALAFGLTAAAAPAAEDGMARGSPKAKVTVVEYASVGCPHCGAWARNVWPEFRARYVDTGKVRFVLREAITGDAELATAGFVTARCAGPAKYFQVVDAIFNQQQAFYGGGAYDRLLAIAKGAGLTEEKFRACLADEDAKAALQARSERAVAAGIDSTPTFLVNGTKVTDSSLAGLSAAIAQAGKPARRR